jgi:hypothetical protein
MSDKMDAAALISLVMKERQEAHFDGDFDGVGARGLEYADQFEVNIESIIDSLRVKRSKSKIQTT